MPKDSERENAILDKGYNAVRLMAKELVENGATLADILWHANQLWHEFKVGAMKAGFVDVINTGMYMSQYNPEQTDKIIGADPNYVRIEDLLAAKEGAKPAEKKVKRFRLPFLRD
jgi:hypothetical protein